MAEKTNANIGFEKQLWDAACVLWGHIPAAEYRKVIIGLIFLRYISAAFDRQREKLIAEGDGFEDDRDAYEMDNVFFVPEEARWNNISSKAHTPEIGTIIDNAMRAIEAENKKLKNVLPKNYASPDLDKQVLGDVVDIFTNNIDMSDATASEDLLGRTYEYCIAQFAEKEGVGGGEFYTPSSIVKTLVSILRPFDNCRVYDCCCGSGGMFVQSEKFIEAHGHKRGAISVYGQEANPDTWKMAKMNMAIRGIDADLGPYNADTFTNDLHPTLKADFILANPPFNYHPWNQEKLLEDKRWKYGTPPAGNANYAWIQHMIHHLAPSGKIGLVLANGALSTQSSGEGEIRKNIIEADLIEGIIAISADIAWGVWLYYQATGDDDFMNRRGCELLIEIARFWASRVEWQDDTQRYEIKNVIGPDEYKDHVDNNAFTNYLTVFAMEQAERCIKDMPTRWPDAYAKLGDSYDLNALAAELQDKKAKVYLPQPNADGIVPQNAQYLGLDAIDLSKYKNQQGVSSIYEDYSPAQMNQLMVSKQADLVMLMRIMPDLFDAETRRKNFMFYESRTLHDSSLSHGQHCVLAAWEGLDDMALDMYRHAIAIDLGPNMKSSDLGIHSASMGNVWQCVVCGFAGLEWHEGGLSLRSHLPASWQRAAFNIVWRGAKLHVEVTHAGITVTHRGGSAVEITVDGQPVKLAAE